MRRNRRDVSKPPRSRRRRWALGGLVALLVVAVVVGGGVAWGFWSFASIPRVDLDLAEVEEPTEPVNILLVGSDSRAKVSEDDPDAEGLIGKGSPTGQRSDSLMIARVDPKEDRVDLLSIPRDLWVTIAGTGEKQRINTAYSKSAQAVVDTIESTLGISIHHFVEVDFSGFRDLIEALGGVPMYFDSPVRDKNSGLAIETKGCTVLDGAQGLAFARARHLQWYNGHKWVSDPTADLGRMTRQQLLARAAMDRAQTLGLTDVGKLKKLVDASIGSVKLDSKWGASDLIGMGRRLANLDPQRMQTHSLPVTPFRTSGGAKVVLLDDELAEPTLDIFRGTAVAAPVTTTTSPPIDPEDVSVEVVNSSNKDGEGRRVSYVLADGGFGIGDVLTGDSEEPRSLVQYPKGQKDAAELVAGWISPSPKLIQDRELSSGSVRLVLGEDFEHVFEPSGSPAGAEHATTVPSSGSESTATSTTTTTTQPGWKPGVAPKGTVCS